MNDDLKDPARRALEVLTTSVKVPPPPQDLRTIGTGPVIGRSLYLLAASLVAALLLAGWLLRESGLPVVEAPALGVRVEHLRVGGRPVPARILAPPGTGAVIVMMDSESESEAGASHDRLETGAAVVALNREQVPLEEPE